MQCDSVSQTRTKNDEIYDSVTYTTASDTHTNRIRTNRRREQKTAATTTYIHYDRKIQKLVQTTYMCRKLGALASFKISRFFFLLNESEIYFLGRAIQLQPKEWFRWQCTLNKVFILLFWVLSSVAMAPASKITEWFAQNARKKLNEWSNC